jgi:hypothetical protein
MPNVEAARATTASAAARKLRTLLARISPWDVIGGLPVIDEMRECGAESVPAIFTSDQPSTTTHAISNYAAI